MNHLAMLAIPVILSLVFGFAGEVRAEEFQNTQAAEEIIQRDLEERGIEAAPDAMGRFERDKRTQKKRLEQALIDGDFKKFLEAAKDTPFAEIMTKDAFEELVAQYKLRKEGYTPSPFMSNV